MLADNWFTSALGGSWLNHLWLVCACTATFPHAPAKLVAEPVMDATGRVVDLKRDGSVTPDGFAVDHLEPFNPPYQAGTPDDERVPPQSLPTIGDRLSDAGVSWAWYAEGWNDAVAGHPAPSFTFHRNRSSTSLATLRHGGSRPAPPGRAGPPAGAARRHAAGRGLVKPLGVDSDNAGEGSMIVAENRVVNNRQAVQASAASAAYRDLHHLGRLRWLLRPRAPPVIDRWGPSNRVPTIVISPWARRSYIDSTRYETVSLLRFIEWRWGVAPLAARDTHAANLVGAFDSRPTPSATER